MSSKNPRDGKSRMTRNTNEANAVNAREGQRLPDNPGTSGDPAERQDPGHPQSQPTPGEFGERGMGIAAKE